METLVIKKKLVMLSSTVRGNITYSKNEIIERDEENNVYAYQMKKGIGLIKNRGLIALGLFNDYDDIVTVLHTEIWSCNAR